MYNKSMEIKKEHKLRVGIFTDAFFPMIDGVINVVHNHAVELSKFMDVTIIAAVGRKEFDDSVLPYKVIRCNKKFNLPFIDYDLPMPKFDKKFIQEVKNMNFDIIHIHSPFSIGKLGVKLAKAKNIPVISSLHSQFKKDFLTQTKSKFLANIMTKIVISVFNECDECYAVNNEVAKVFYEDYKIKKMPKVLNNGTDLIFFDNNDEIENLRNFYNIKKEDKVLLFVGRICKLKNIYFILDSLKILKENNFKFKMIYVGNGQDFENLKKQIELSGLTDNVILTGKVTDRTLLTKLYNLADLFLFPSLYDCSSLVQIEAASQKTPTLFIKGSVTSGTCSDEDAYFSENDAKSYANKIMDIFKNKEEYERKRIACYENLYITWKNVAQKVYKIYLSHIDNFDKNIKKKKRDKKNKSILKKK